MVTTPQCSAAFTYRHDDIAPNVPSNLQAVPGTPTQDPAPTLRGTAEAGSTVSVYVDTGCTGTPVSTSTAADFGDADGLPLGSADAQRGSRGPVSATDAAGNVSACSPAFTVTIDTVGPAAPTALTVLPAAVTNDTTPAIQGTAEAGSTVQVFLDTVALLHGHRPTTPGPPPTSGTLTASPLRRRWPRDRTASTPGPPTSRATSGPARAPSHVTDRHRRAGPADRPGPPGFLTDARIGRRRSRARAEAGTTVTLYLDSTPGAGVNCNAVVGGGSAASFGDANGLTLSVDLADGTNLLRATATDDLGQESACSTSSATVDVDTDGPTAPTGLSVVGGSPTSDTTPPCGARPRRAPTVRVYVDSADCSAAAVATGTAAEFALAAGLEVVGQLSTGAHTLRATATDAAGNEGACSTGQSVTIDFTDPVITGFARVGPSPTSNTTPAVTGLGVRGRHGRHLRRLASCAGGVEESGSVAEFAERADDHPGAGRRQPLLLGPGHRPGRQRRAPASDR